MKTVHKFKLPMPSDYFTIEMPRWAKILHVDTQQGIPVMWALVDTDQPMEPRQFRWAGTGHPVEKPGYEFKYVGTFQGQQGLLIWHIFEVVPEVDPHGF